MSSAEPPPPGPAQRLVAEAGFVVYEGGRSIFDEPVLVYLPRSGSRWSEFTIHNHVDSLLGVTRNLESPNPFKVNIAIGIDDTVGNRLVEVRPSTKLFQFQFDVSGVANGRYTLSSTRTREIGLAANRESFGLIRGEGHRGLGGRVMNISDHDGHHVGQLRLFVERWNPIHQSASYVLSLDPNLGGELRRLLIAAPVVFEGVRQRRARAA